MEIFLRKHEKSVIINFVPGLDVTGRPWKGGSAPACEKKAAWAATAGLLRAINWAAIGLRPGGCGPKPLPNGDLSMRGSVKLKIAMVSQASKSR